MDKDTETIVAIQDILNKSPDEVYKWQLETLRHNESVTDPEDEDCLFDEGCNCTECKKDPSRFKHNTMGI